MNEAETKHSICREIFKAIHEGRWLSIEYQNKENKTTKYWIGIRDINPFRCTMSVDGLHLGMHTLEHLECIYIDSILSANIVDGTYCERNQRLIRDIAENPEKYQPLFDHVANLKVLNYLEECNHMDVVPYKTDFALLKCLDREKFISDTYLLTDGQFKQIVKVFQIRTKQNEGRLQIQRLAMNVVSIHTREGLYVLAYRALDLDVKHKVLRPAEDITVCSEFTINGKKESIRKYLDAEDYELLDHFEENAEQIKNCLQKPNIQVDDLPYVIGMGMDIAIDLRKEYKAILDMDDSDTATFPIKAFFGELLKRPIRSRTTPIALVNNRINVDQLLAIHNGMKYPLAYIQGPPGTGKTNTIINTISTAFFNEKTVLFTSYNNHPIDGVVKKLTDLRYRGKRIPFPIIRLGNRYKVAEAIQYIAELYKEVEGLTVYEKTLDRKKDTRIQNAKALSSLLKDYEELLDLRERKETIQSIVDYNARQTNFTDMRLEISLTNQAYNVEKEIEKKGVMGEQKFLELLDVNEEEFLKYLYYTSIKYIQSIPKKCPELLDFIYEPNEEKRVSLFTEFLSKTMNVERLLKVFPIVATTCIAAGRLGQPKPYFDMVIMDEASQCNTAVSLVPIIRGESLMLVGDPQQLNPVIVLPETTNVMLKQKYCVAEEYDYCKNSIYKTYLACDSVSDEVLLRSHYRCHKKIVSFNNQKYYHGRLQILTQSKEKQPLVYVDVAGTRPAEKNTSPGEVEQIVEYCKANPDKSIGIITPFVNQKKLIEEELTRASLNNITCGTVHAFQGDEKEVILFSTAITEGTQAGTYSWLKTNKELLNVATSRAKDKLIVLSSSKDVERLHQDSSDDDLYELIRYTRSNGETKVTKKTTASRALGVKPFSTKTEEAFLGTLRHALSNIWDTQNRYSVEKEVAIAHVFKDNTTYDSLFYMGRFDFVVYEVNGDEKVPVLAIELDGKEHLEDEVVRRRDAKKNAICKAHNLELIRVDNSYARRYNYIKDILVQYFKK